MGFFLSWAFYPCLVIISCLFVKVMGLFSDVPIFLLILIFSGCSFVTKRNTSIFSKKTSICCIPKPDRLAFSIKNMTLPMKFLPLQVCFGFSSSCSK